MIVGQGREKEMFPQGFILLLFILTSLSKHFLCKSTNSVQIASSYFSLMQAKIIDKIFKNMKPKLIIDILEIIENFFQHEFMGGKSLIITILALSQDILNVSQLLSS